MEISPSHSTSRLNHVDALRGLAAMSVCLFHFISNRPDFPSTGSFVITICQYGYLGVEVFFVISGFIIPVALFRSHYRITHFSKFLARRIIRIDPPYLITAVLSILLFSLSSYYKGTSYAFPISAALAHIGYLNGFLGLPWAVPIFWTLAIEFQYYLFIAVCFPLFISNDKNIPLAVCMIFLLSGILTTYRPLVFYYSPLFSCGFFCYLKKQGQIDIVRMLLLLFLNVLVIYHKMGIESALACTVASWVILTGSVNHRALVFLGKISYSIYLIHIPIGTRIINFLFNIKYLSSNGYMVLCLSLILTLVTAYGFYQIIERPSISWSQKIVYR